MSLVICGYYVQGKALSCRPYKNKGLIEAEPR